MSVQNPHHFSPLWLFSNSKQINTQNTGKSGFATLNGGHVPIKRSYPEEVPHTIITNINTPFKTKTSEFPSLQSAKTGNVPAVDNGAWSAPRSKGKLYNTVKAGAKQHPPSNNTKSRNADPDKPNSPKVKAPKSHDTSKFDFFNSLRLDEGLIDSDSEGNSYENDGEIKGQDSAQTAPLSSSVETEHRLLKEMGWSDEVEPPLTEEELLTARRQIDRTKKTRSPTVLSPFPWAPKIYIPSDDEELSTDSEDEN